MANIPQYRKLYELLRRHIEKGVYAEGDLLPSENELCMVHSVTRPTVRHALDTLVKDGYIKKHQGKGSIVTSQSKDIGILSIHGTTTALGSQLQTQIVTPPKIIAWPENFGFEISEIERESGCIYMERIRLVANKPVFYDITYLPNINLPRFCNRKFENRSLFEILRMEYQIEVTGGRQRFRALAASDEISSFLQIKKNKPVLHLERRIETSRNNYVFYSSLYCNTEFHALSGSF
jgi:DNA-binding GntR family transcriptional regulator